MGHPLIARRRFCAGAAAIVATGASIEAAALGRIPVGGKITMVLPWAVSSIDPHDLLDPAAALFGHALFDQLYALDSGGEPYPTLAADLPTVQGNKTTIRLRDGLVTARGRKLDARDALFALKRARQGGALAWWGELPVPTVTNDAQGLVFASNDAARIARTLSSPLFALVPRAFDPTNPDGTGALAAQTAGNRLALRRDPNAARGGSFLDEIVVEQAADLSASLRSFEGNLADIGWLGSGLHAPRPGAQSFDLGAAGWITLHTGNEAGTWSAPGLAQRLVDGMPAERLARFGLGPPSAATNGTEWGGKACDLLVQEGSAYLDELGRTVASLLTRPGHEITLKPVPSVELNRRRAAGAYSLALGIVRPFAATTGFATLAALAAASDPTAALDIVRRPPRLNDFTARHLTRTLRLGVLGNLRILGARTPELYLAKSPVGEGWDLPASYRSGP